MRARGAARHPWAAHAGAAAPVAFLAHQPLDAMQTGVEPFGQYVVPDPPGAIGAIASGKAGPDPGDEHLVILSPSTRRAVKPGMEARARHTERLADPRDRPDPSVLRNKREPHIESLAK